MKKTRILYIFFFIVISINAWAVNFNKLLKSSPLVSINHDQKGAFHSVTVYAKANAPFKYVWNAIVDINRYITYMPRVKKSLISEKNNYGKEITARFEIQAPFKNPKYVLTLYLDEKNKKIFVKHVKGDLKGSSWHWSFEEKENGTLIVYTGRTINFSKLIEAFEDKQKSISMGINIASCLATVKSIKDRSEYLYKKARESDLKTKKKK